MKNNPQNEVIEASDPELLPPEPLLSVLMITYNHERYLAEAIDKILVQETDFPFEVVIGEDCSTDGSRQIALDYQNRFPQKIRVLYSPGNVGSSRNFARTLNACRGQYIAICEGDDYWNDPSKLAKQVAWLNGHPDCVITYHDTRTLSDTGDVIRETLHTQCKKGYTSEALQVGAHIPTLSLCFRNVMPELPPEFFRVINGDTFLISLLGCHGRADYLPDISPAIYRHHAGGIWSAIAHDEKVIKGLVTHYWLSLYHRNQGRGRLANILVYKMIGQLMERYSMVSGLAPQWFLSFVFPKQYRSLKALFSKLGMN